MITLAEALKKGEWSEGSIEGEGSRKLSKSELHAIRKYTRRDVEPESVYTFPALAIDTNPTRNGVIYSEDSQKKTLRKWVGIPFLFNASGSGSLIGSADHALNASSQVGRIYKSQYVETGKGTTGTLVWAFTFPDVSPALQEFVNKIDSGILREVSIHVMAKDVVCSICGLKFGEDGHEHWPQETYGKETCYIKTVGELEPLELSSVACPGSTVAHIMDDSEAGNYRVLSLREALRGAHSHFEASMETKEELLLPEASDAPADSSKKDDKESNDEEEAKKKKPDPDNQDDDDDDKKDEKKKEGVKPLSLISPDEECPACHRSESSISITDEMREQILKDYRAEVKSSMAKLEEAYQAKLLTEKEKIEALTLQESQTSFFRDHYISETVKLAISKGLKEATQSEEYAEELRKLNLDAISSIRNLCEKATPKKESALKELEELSQSQFHKTGVSLASSRLPIRSKDGLSTGFSAKIGPATNRG